MSGFFRRSAWLTCIALGLVLAGCGSKSLNRAPVEDRGSSGRQGAVSQPVKQPPGFENAGKAGYYTVKPGDTLIRISLEAGQGRKDIARWNALDNPDKIEVGQVLRVVPPLAGESAVVAKPVATAAVTPTQTTAPDSQPAATQAPAKHVSAPAASNAQGSSGAVQTLSGIADIDWGWPSDGPVIAKYEEAKKGFDLGGSQGDPVYAAADGKVIIAEMGDGTMRFYGNLIIIKHQGTVITAYAHNHTLLVKDEQIVKKGQKIALMGSTGTDRTKLHFEMRKDGKPVDPAKYLPAK